MATQIRNAAAINPYLARCADIKQHPALAYDMAYLPQIREGLFKA